MIEWREGGQRQFDASLSEKTYNTQTNLKPLTLIYT